MRSRLKTMILLNDLNCERSILAHIFLKTRVHLQIKMIVILGELGGRDEYGVVEVRFVSHPGILNE